MTQNLSRRKAIAAGAGTAGLLFGSPATPTFASELPDVWGEDFLTQWSPPANVVRDLTPGPTPIRLSCGGYTLRNTPRREGVAMVPLPEQIKTVRNAGYTACESGSLNWLDTPDSQIRELHDALKHYDVMFYALHQWSNIIDPDLERADKNKRSIIMAIESAERLGLEHIVLHTGGRNPRNKDRPHKDNWTRETWEMSVNAVKRIIRDTAGSKVNLGFEAVNCCNNNTPQSHIRLREDVGDPRVKVMLDPVNMLHPGVYFRTTELLNLCFDLFGEDITYCHAKDALWDSMSTAINEGVVLGQGCMDYEQFLARMSRMKRTRLLLIEHLPMDQYPPSKAFLEETAAKIGVTIYS
ncbi:sugar phosphate isomerase/epimerase family protein [Candidatus Latescibacterota bacterium]